MPFIRFQLVLFGLAVLVQAVKDPFSALKRDYLDDAKDSVSRMRQKWCTTCLELCGNPNARYWDEHMNSEAFAVRRILRVWTPVPHPCIQITYAFFQQLKLKVMLDGY